MTWNDLAGEIEKMNANVRKQDVRLVSDLDGPNQQVEAIKLSNANTDIWHGISIGSDLTFATGHPFFEIKRRSEH
jgi:hypothetical protein